MKALQQLYKNFIAALKKLSCLSFITKNIIKTLQKLYKCCIFAFSYKNMKRHFDWVLYILFQM